jgi:hypothetical protein
MVKDGLASAFYRVFYNKKELPNTEGRFSYVYAEEEDDECTITFRLNNPNDVDLPEYQEGAMLEVVWGYIGGPTTTRKVWIHNAVPQFSKENIVLSIEASEKAQVMRGATERVIHREKGLPGLVQDKADKHGLIAEVEINPYEGIVLDDLPTGHELISDSETVSQFVRRLNEEKARRGGEANLKAFGQNQQEAKASPTKYRRKLKDLNDKYKPTWEQTPDDLIKNEKPIDQKSVDAVNAKLDILRRGGAPGQVLDLYRFPTDKTIPQAGKSDKQVINDAAKRTKGGPTIVETRDDRITIKKRSYNQPPYRAYEYGGSDGELLDFKPETKNKPAGGSAASMAAAGWSALNKNYFTAAADPANPANNASLAKALKLKRDYEYYQKAGGGGKIVGKREQYIGMMPGVVEVNSNRPQFDKTRKHGEPMVAKIKITVNDALSALTNAINEYTGKAKDQQRDVYNALGVNPESAFTDASNKQQSNELKMNPATIQTWGDPNIETGILISIVNASQKHSGNYYIMKSTHYVDKSGGYITEMDGGKHGHNIVSSSEYVKAKDAGRVTNKKMGKIRTEIIKTKVPKIKSNGFTEKSKGDKLTN